MSWFFPNIQALDEPNTDNLSNKRGNHYFRDALAIKLNKPSLTPSQLQHAIFAYMPTWVTVLMRIRNKIVKMFGFDVGVDNLTPTSDELEVGDTAGFLTIMEKVNNEIISFADDKHMTIFISVLKQSDRVVISTLVNKKTLVGRIYVNSILPFHYVIARVVMNNALKANRI
ncbi:MAG: DUF2867 domain-containing protein [Paraglaciecola sp.]|uniref:DUF2867 domain-containing protein n=1 Tax=Paraglaciecola sp. TaxID=1920173 RepID=UPI0032977BCE